MGYNTRVRGEITFHPPIPWGVVKDDEYLKGWRDSKKCIQLRVQDEQVETDEGTLTRRSAVGIVPILDEPYKAYEIEAEVRELVSRYCSANGQTCRGYLEGEGEDSGVLWRIYVRYDAEVVRVEPRIIWPDDNESES